MFKQNFWKNAIDSGNIRFSLNGANQINLSKLDKRLPLNAKMFSDHLSIILVWNDVQRFFHF
jgi:hypothetical protein